MSLLDLVTEVVGVYSNGNQFDKMPYRDREMYLGNSAVIGVLDKGGKWRKRDWYLKT